MPNRGILLIQITTKIKVQKEPLKISKTDFEQA